MFTSTAGPRSLRGNIIFTTGLVLALYVCWLLRGVLLMIYVSALFAVVLSPVVEWICSVRVLGRRSSRTLAVGLLFAGVSGALVTFFVFALPPVAHDLRTFIRELPAHVPIIEHRLQRIPMVDRLDLSQVSEQLESSLSFGASYIVSSLPGWATRILDIVTTLILTVYFILEGDSAYQWFLSFFPV